ncbi:MAG TPA: DUF883 domain-containing protein [Burkholderiaceae bacterium]|jgi:ElaB/YqjD/DUF883 family membrane-anchored ribosome-binding protein|nr:DUF883 domain-containing protein [Burkholderiaceae bacterium]
MASIPESTTERLSDEVAEAIEDAQQILQRAAAETGDKARELREEVESRLLYAKLRLQELNDEAVERARVVARTTDDFVHERPWQSIAIGAFIGLLIGLLIGRR